jgi:hypothetical protein
MTNASGSTAIIGGHFSLSLSNTVPVIHIRNSGTTLCSIVVDNNTYNVMLYKGTSTKLDESGAGFVSAGVPFHLEMKVVLDTGTSGSYEVRINGNVVFSGSGLATSASGTTWNEILLGQPANNWANSIMDVDNLVVLDGTGTVNNDFIGECRVTYRTGTADGTNTGSTPSTGTSRYAMIDDTAPNSDTDYSALTASGQLDTFVMQDVPVSGVSTVLGFQTCIWAEKTDAGAGSIAPIVRTGGVDHEGTTTSLANGTYAYVINQYDVDPATSSRMSEADFNGAELGYKRTA